MAEMGEIKIRYSGAVPGTEGLGRRVLSGLIRQAWEAVGHHWHRTMRPKHFTVAGAKEYGYSPRAGESGNTRKNYWTSYTGRKQRTMGHRRPLVFTGELREMTRAYRLVATATATRTRLRIVLPQAQKANFRSKTSRIDMRDELTRISEAEARELVALHDKTMTFLLAQAKG